MGASTKIGGLTPKERVFVKEYVKTGNASKSAQIAYPDQKKENITSYVANKLKKPRIIKAIEKILDDKGITDEYIVDKLKRHIDDGIGIKPTAQTSLKALEIAVKLRNYVSKDKGRRLHLHLLQTLPNNEKINLKGNISTILEGEEVK